MALTLGISIVHDTAKAGTVGIDTIVTAAGTAPYTYQWYRAAGTSITPGSGNLVAGQTQASYAGRGEPTGLQTYACIVTDSAAATSTAQVTLRVRDSNNDTQDLSRFNALPNTNAQIPDSALGEG
jgi:hypothetical protein